MDLSVSGSSSTCSSSVSGESGCKDDPRYDAAYQRKRRQLRRYLPRLKHHLEQMRLRGESETRCFFFLDRLRVALLTPETKVVHKDQDYRIPFHDLVRGEVIIKKDVLGIEEEQDEEEEVEDEVVSALWRTRCFRSAVRKRMCDAVAAAADALANANDAVDAVGDCWEIFQVSPEEMEEEIFDSVDSHEEYLESAARIIVRANEVAATEFNGDDNIANEAEEEALVSEEDEEPPMTPGDSGCSSTDVSDAEEPSVNAAVPEAVGVVDDIPEEDPREGPEVINARTRVVTVLEVEEEDAKELGEAPDLQPAIQLT